MITIKKSQTCNGGGSFALIETGGKKFLCPAWIEVPMDTEMADIIVEESPSDSKKDPIHPDREWTFIGSKGNEYQVYLQNGGFSCTCPAAMFQKFKDCKHIISAKKELR